MRYRVVVRSPLGDEDAHEFYTLQTAMARAEELVRLGALVSIKQTTGEAVLCDT